MGGIAEQVAIRVKLLIARGKWRAESEKFVLIFLVECLFEALGASGLDQKKSQKADEGFASHGDDKCK